MDIEKTRLNRVSERIPILFSLVKSKQENKLERLNQVMLHNVSRRLDRHNADLKALEIRIAPALSRLIDRQRHTLDILEQRAKALDPTLLLQRGYSITTLNGHALRSPSEIKHGDILTTRLAEGTVTSVVEKLSKYNKQNNK